jgi:hypothetical protein
MEFDVHCGPRWSYRAKVVDIDVSLGITDELEAGSQQIAVDSLCVWYEQVDVSIGAQRRIWITGGDLRAFQDYRRSVVDRPYSFEYGRCRQGDDAGKPLVRDEVRRYRPTKSSISACCEYFEPVCTNIVLLGGKVYEPVD